MSLVTRRTFVKGMAAVPLVVPALAYGPAAMAQGTTIRVGSKNFPEALIHGEIYAILLENAGFTVERNLNLGGTVVAHEALINDELDLYPEYTGTGLLVVLGATLADVPGLAGGGATPTAGATPVAASPDEAVYAYVKEQYQQQFGLVWLDQTPMNDTQALAVTRQFSEENGITTITQLAELSQSTEISISAPSDFEEREDGLLGLQTIYGLTATVTGVDPGLKYQAFLDGDANVVLAFSTDAEIGFNDLIVLQDDKALWPPYHVAPVVRQNVLDANPQIAEVLNAVAPLITTEIQIGLNGQVVGDEKREPADVARAFLQEQGLISA